MLHYSKYRYRKYL